MRKAISVLTVLVILAVGLSACSSIQQDNFQGMDAEDKALESRVQQRLDAERAIRNTMIQVEVEYGFATIYGPKPPPNVLARIISIVENTPGIKGVDAAFK